MRRRSPGAILNKAETFQPTLDFVETRLKPLRLGLVFAFVAILFGFGLAALFSANDDWIKSKFREDAMAVLESRYGGDEGRVREVCRKSWVYFKRAHIYSGGLGAFALPTILLLALLRPPGPGARLAALLVGLGAPLYGLYWMLVALKAPSVASIASAAKSLSWLAALGGGASGVGVLVTILLCLRAVYRRG